MYIYYVFIKFVYVLCLFSCCILFWAGGESALLTVPSSGIRNCRVGACTSEATKRKTGNGKRKSVMPKQQNGKTAGADGATNSRCRWPGLPPVSGGSPS